MAPRGPDVRAALLSSLARASLTGGETEAQRGETALRGLWEQVSPTLICPPSRSSVAQTPPALGGRHARSPQASAQEPTPPPRVPPAHSICPPRSRPPTDPPGAQADLASGLCLWFLFLIPESPGQLCWGPAWPPPAGVHFPPGPSMATCCIPWREDGHLGPCWLGRGPRGEVNLIVVLYGH